MSNSKNKKTNFSCKPGSSKKEKQNINANNMEENDDEIMLQLIENNVMNPEEISMYMDLTYEKNMKNYDNSDNEKDPFNTFQKETLEKYKNEKNQLLEKQKKNFLMTQNVNNNNNNNNNNKIEIDIDEVNKIIAQEDDDNEKNIINKLKEEKINETPFFIIPEYWEEDAFSHLTIGRDKTSMFDIFNEINICKMSNTKFDEKYLNLIMEIENPFLFIKNKEEIEMLKSSESINNINALKVKLIKNKNNFELSYIQLINLLQGWCCFHQQSISWNFKYSKNEKNIHQTAFVDIIFSLNEKYFIVIRCKRSNNLEEDNVRFDQFQKTNNITKKSTKESIGKEILPSFMYNELLEKVSDISFEESLIMKSFFYIKNLKPQDNVKFDSDKMIIIHTN
jgi:hypothetical protein